VWFALLAAVLLGCDASSPEIGPVKVDEAKAKMAEGYQKYAPPNERERLAKEKAESEGAAKATGDEPAGEAQETEPAPESTETPAATPESETPPKE
jgi:outer membrane biosynthesis protein TonB